MAARAIRCVRLDTLSLLISIEPSVNIRIRCHQQPQTALLDWLQAIMGSHPVHVRACRLHVCSKSAMPAAGGDCLSVVA
jgi:hypothetical protein